MWTERSACKALPVLTAWTGWMVSTEQLDLRGLQEQMEWTASTASMARSARKVLPALTARMAWTEPWVRKVQSAPPVLLVRKVQSARKVQPVLTELTELTERMASTARSVHGVPQALMV